MSNQWTQNCTRVRPMSNRVTRWQKFILISYPCGSAMHEYKKSWIKLQALMKLCSCSKKTLHWTGFTTYVISIFFVTWRLSRFYLKFTDAEFSFKFTFSTVLLTFLGMRISRKTTKFALKSCQRGWCCYKR